MVHHEPILGSPYRRSFPLAGSCACALSGRRPGKDRIEIGRIAAVLPEAMGPLQISSPLQIGKSPLYRGAGELKIGGDGIDARPTLPFGVGSVVEIHIDSLCSMAEFSIGIDASEPAHGLPPGCVT